MKRDSKVTQDPQMVAYECKSCGEIVQGPVEIVNYCGICGKKLDKEWGLRTGRRRMHA
jgi:uncharacterized OB-fold protein